MTTISSLLLLSHSIARSVQWHLLLPLVDVKRARGDDNECEYTTSECKWLLENFDSISSKIERSETGKKWWHIFSFFLRFFYCSKSNRHLLCVFVCVAHSRFPLINLPETEKEERKKKILKIGKHIYGSPSPYDENIGFVREKQRASVARNGSVAAV